MRLFHREKETDIQEAVPARRRRWWIPAAVVAVILAAAAPLLGGSLLGGGGAALDLSDTTTLERLDLQNTISATGMVESAKSLSVYSTVSYTVQEVFVEVGDYVEEGQLLCKLDDQLILDQIESQEASLSVSENASAASIASARDSYEQFKNALDNGLNASILSAETAVTNAQSSYNSAVDTYERYKAGLEEGENATLLTQENAVRTARVSMETAADGLESAQEALADAEEAIGEAEEALTEAEDALADAEWEVEDIQSGLSAKERQLSDLETADRNYAGERLRLEGEIAALEAQLLLPEADAVSLQAQLDAKEAELLTLESNHANFTANRESLQTDITTLRLEQLRLETALSSLQSQVPAAESAVTQAERAYETCESQVESARRSLENAQEAYASAIRQYEASLTTVDNALADYAKAVETTYEAYQTALTNLEAAKTSAQSQLESYQNNLNSAYAGANKAVNEVGLRQLRADLAETEITAPAAGTVTAVYAEVGSAGAGLLFLIEDTDDLVVATSVKDYDMGLVSAGMAVTIKSDATGEEVFDGEITTIAPTANKNAAGVTDTSGDVSFAADVAVLSRDTGLRIGMSVRLDFVVEEALGVLAVPYEAVYENEAGETCLLAAVEQEDGRYLLTELPVTAGLETDLDVAVEGEGLTEGLRVLRDPAAYLPLAGQSLPLGDGAGGR